jgi:uncharacterized protein
MLAAQNEETNVTALYITSRSENAGKTMLCAGLGKYWLSAGKKTGYLRLLDAADKKNTSDANSDAAFIRRQSGLKDLPDTLLSTPSDLKQFYSQAAQGKEVVIIEGLPLATSGNLIETLDALVVVLHEYSMELSASLPEYQKLGKRLLGVIINKAPRSKLEALRNQALDELASAGGIQLLGIIPEDRLLMTMTVAGLAEVLQGKILNNAEKSGELIENYMLGALSFESGEEYFKIKNNKAVILKSERPDMQLAALQTSLRCMVLSGSLSPIPVVVQQAKTRKVPLVSTGGDVITLITTLEKALTGLKFNQDSKMERLMDLLKRNINFKLLDQVVFPAAK